MKRGVRIDITLCCTSGAKPVASHSQFRLDQSTSEIQSEWRIYFYLKVEDIWKDRLKNRLDSLLPPNDAEHHTRLLKCR